MIPRLFRVSSVREDTRDTATLVLVPEDGAELRFEPGQYTMLYVFGVGEVPSPSPVTRAVPKFWSTPFGRWER
jgi:ferredoxin-NADP reductase